MKPIFYIDRITGQRERELVYGAEALKLLYGSGALSRLLGRPLRYIVSCFALFSTVYGWWQRQPWTACKVDPFIKTYGVDKNEFVKQHFSSFNDFFIRELKASARPLAPGDSRAVMPADGRYRVYDKVPEVMDVKGQKLDLKALLGDEQMASRYADGSVVMARLCPSDYHRFHFPIDCVPTKARLINGAYYSVNPIALASNLSIFWQNKRMVTLLRSKVFGQVLYVEVGATGVGTIAQTFQSDVPQAKGAEKGYFAFGGSSLLIFFLPGKICFDSDLLEATKEGSEMRCLMGQSLGVSYSPLTAAMSR